MKRIVAALLALLTVCLVTACAVPDEDNPIATTPVASGGTEEFHRESGLPSRDFGNRDFRVMATSEAAMDECARDVVYLEDKKADVINEAVYNRNGYVEKTYKMKVKAIFEDKADMAGKIARSISGGISVCDVVESTLFEYASLIDQAALLPLNSLSYIDLTQPFWDQNCRRNLSIAGNLYCCSGDIMITDKMATWAISFNRDLINSHKLESPYTLVDSGDWTYDKMYELAAAVSDAESHAANDFFGTTWGVLSQNANTFYLWQGSGCSLIVKDPETDRPSLGALTESAYDSMLKVGKIQFDTKVTLLANRITGVPSQFFDGTHRIFKEGHGLFFVGSLTMVEWMRAYEVDFGVLPLPKYDHDQKTYYSSVSNTQSYALAIPANTPDPEFTSIITEALACESTDTLKEAYYTKTLELRGLRRPEDVRMLDLAFKNRVYELTQIFSWADGLIQDISGTKSQAGVTRIKTYYDSYHSAVNVAVDKYLEKHT